MQKEEVKKIVLTASEWYSIFLCYVVGLSTLDVPKKTNKRISEYLTNKYYEVEEEEKSVKLEDTKEVKPDTNTIECPTCNGDGVYTDYDENKDLQTTNCNRCGGTGKVKVNKPDTNIEMNNTRYDGKVVKICRICNQSMIEDGYTMFSIFGDDIVHEKCRIESGEGVVKKEVDTNIEDGLQNIADKMDNQFFENTNIEKNMLNEGELETTDKHLEREGGNIPLETLGLPQVSGLGIVDSAFIDTQNKRNKLFAEEFNYLFGDESMYMKCNYGGNLGGICECDDDILCKHRRKLHY